MLMVWVRDCVSQYIDMMQNEGAVVELAIDYLYPLQVAKTSCTREVIRLPIAEVMDRKCINSRNDLDEVKRLGESQS